MATTSKRIRRVMRTFEVRQVTEDNAVELALWLRDEGRKLDPPVHGHWHPVVFYGGEKPVLVTGGWDYGSEVLPGSWIGWGWPQMIPEGDIAAPKLLVISGESIEAETDDQGFEEVSPRW